MQKKSKEYLAAALDFMQKGRVQLYTPFLKQDSLTIVGPSFKYENIQAAFDLVRDQYFTLWMDSLFNKLNENKEYDSNCRKFILSAIEKLYEIILETKKSAPTLELSLIRSKEEAIQILLAKASDMDKKFNMLKYSYEKDKKLFERKLKKYENEINYKKLM